MNTEILAAFFQTHDYLVDHVQSPVHRVLMDEIDWSHRLIGIKGSRGVGKTTFLLQYAKERFGHDRRCLYVNLNSFYFTQHSLVDFAAHFVQQGGRTLLLDQMFKYDHWAVDLRACYDRYPMLHIVFSASPVMRLIDGNEHIGNIVRSYNLRGFSFREYLNLQSGSSFEMFTLDELLRNHEQLSRHVCNQTKPLWYFQDYLEHGYYPFFLEHRNFMETLLKTMNMMIEVDILLIKQIDLKYLSKIRTLLHIMMNQTPGGLNVSQLSQTIDVSRATVMNYIKCLQDARMLNLLYPQGNVYPKKPSRVYMHNTNLMYALQTCQPDTLSVMETFLYNALHARHKVNVGGKGMDFMIDGRDHFHACTPDTLARTTFRTYNAVSDIEQGEKHNIPIWLFGFLY
ncbi:MAG: AAA family ATPase [Paludibacteraceae bacterium]|nr:AAA family ATPase [Paludibacteraceae bacterium]